MELSQFYFFTSLTSRITEDKSGTDLKGAC